MDQVQQALLLTEFALSCLFGKTVSFKISTLNIVIVSKKQMNVQLLCHRLWCFFYSTDLFRSSWFTRFSPLDTSEATLMYVQGHTQKHLKTCGTRWDPSPPFSKFKLHFLHDDCQMSCPVFPRCDRAGSLAQCDARWDLPSFIESPAQRYIRWDLP